MRVQICILVNFNEPLNINTKIMKQSRRKFLKNATFSSLAVTSALAGFSQPAPAPQIPNSTTSFPKKTILFQGDSITDGKRSRNNDWNHVLGHGYAYLIASRLWYDNTDKELMFYNRGLSGNRVKDLEARWQQDAIELKPDILSILIGVNDVFAIIENKEPDTFEHYETSFRNILDCTKEALPNTRIVLCEPFILPLGRVNKSTEIWQSEIKKRQELVKTLSESYNTLFVSLQKPFIEACKKAPANYWIWDGIHPMPAGHELIARLWIEEIKKVYPELN